MKKKNGPDYASYFSVIRQIRKQVRCTFVSYLNFKKVKEILNNIAFTDKSTFVIYG